MTESAPKIIEIEGDTVEEAISKAVDTLNAKREEINIKVVSEEKKGLFGMGGAQPAKIKASLKEKNKKT